MPEAAASPSGAASGHHKTMRTRGLARAGSWSCACQKRWRARQKPRALVVLRGPEAAASMPEAAKFEEEALRARRDCISRQTCARRDQALRQRCKRDRLRLHASHAAARHRCVLPKIRRTCAANAQPILRARGGRKHIASNFPAQPAVPAGLVPTRHAAPALAQVYSPPPPLPPPLPPPPPSPPPSPPVRAARGARASKPPAEPAGQFRPPLASGPPRKRAR